MRYRSLVFVAFLLAVAAVPSPRAQTPAPAAASPRLEGDWVRIDPDGAGSFDGLGASIPPAQLLPGVTAGGGRGGRDAAAGAVRQGRSRAAPTRRASRTSSSRSHAPGVSGASNGALLVNPDSGGVHFIEHKDEVIFAGERGGVRHIYLDGRAHPSPWTPTPAGHAVGRYEGNTLVVETTGFTPGGVPGGGVRTAETVLVERFEVSPDGRRLTITYTWTDPKIYQKPHQYPLLLRSRTNRELRRIARQLCARRVVRRGRSGGETVHRSAQADHQVTCVRIRESSWRFA